MSGKSLSEVLIAAIEVTSEMLESCWHGRYPELSKEPGELIVLDRGAAGNNRKIKQIRMGLPKLEYTHSNATLCLTLKQRALFDQEVVLLTEQGAGSPWLSSIRKMNLPRDRVLAIEISFIKSSERHKLIYKSLPQRELSLAWVGNVEYSYSGNDTDKRLLAEHYDARKAVVLYQLPLPPLNLLLHDVIVTPAASDVGFINYGLYSFSTAAAYPFESQSTGIAPLLAGSGLAMVSLAMAFPENLLGKPPLDVAWLPSLVVPPNTVTHDPSQDVPAPGIGFNFGYRRTSYAKTAPQVGNEDTLTVSPLVSVVGAGYDKQPLELSRSGAAEVEFIGEHRGGLHEGNGTYYYVPPANQQPAIVYEQDCKTLQAPAILETLRERASADVIQVTVNGGSALSTFVTLYARQTHYLTFALERNALKLKLWYFDADLGEDMPVPDDETEWTIIAGNGSVSSAGVFTQAPAAPTPFTVIAGRDLGSSRLLYWAVTVIPVPLYTPPQFVALFES
ncbi:hypothetical protein ACYU03_07945 [Pseudomonas sp. X10]